MALDPLTGLVVIDEIQRRPDVFPVLRVLVDRPGIPARFLILGSASPSLMRDSSESLAGRIACHELNGFDLGECGDGKRDVLWLRGGFPRAFLADGDPASERWREEFIRTFLERDIPALGLRLPAATLGRFWSMLAHYSGQTWNGSELARAFGVTLESVDILRPWHENLAKRQVKAPKVYLGDSGMLHTLLGIGDLAALHGHPKVGASWEGFVLPGIARILGVRGDECHYWKLHSGAELDLFVQHRGRRLGFEVKFSDVPRVTPSMRSSLECLALDRLYVVHAGRDAFPLAERVEAVPLRAHFVGSGLEP